MKFIRGIRVFLRKDMLKRFGICLEVSDINFYMFIRRLEIVRLINRYEVCCKVSFFC